MDSKQPAINPGWKISIIPKEAGNATEPVYASAQEIEGVIDNIGNLVMPEPIESKKAVEAAPRYNANVPYTPQPVIYSMNDQIVMAAIRRAVDNGWNDYHRFANDAVTIGMEAEAVITGMKKRQASINELLFDKDFNRCLYQEDWRQNMFDMISAPNSIKYIEDYLERSNT